MKYICRNVNSSENECCKRQKGVDIVVRQTMDFLISQDPEVGKAIQAEYNRQRSNIELIASENFVSEAVLAAASTVLTNKYAEGYPGKRYYGGCECVDIVENLARDRVKELFSADHANVQPHSGASANFAVYAAFCEHGDTVLGMDLANGGHLTHGSPVNFSGKNYNMVSYGVDPVTHRIDYDQLRDLAIQHKPKMIISGASAYSRIIDFKTFGDIAKEVGAYLFVDMAHIAGLVATGLHPSPIPYADVVTTTTHKTLRGPRGGVILCKEEHAQKIDKAIFPGSQGGPLMHIIAAKAIAFAEALRPEFKSYQEQVLKNAKALSQSLMNAGFDLVSGGTDNHLMLVDLRHANITGKDMEKRLDEVRITVNKNTIPNDPQSPFVTSGIRVGTPAATTRGFVEDDMNIVGQLIWDTATTFDSKQGQIRDAVQSLCEKYPLYD